MNHNPYDAVNLPPNTENPLTPSEHFLFHLKTLTGRQDNPYSNRPNITWPDLVDDLLTQINTGSICLAVQTQTEKISYGLYEIKPDTKTLVIVIPTDDPQFGLRPECIPDSFAELAVEVYKIHQDSLHDPKRLLLVNQAYGLTAKALSAHQLYNSYGFRPATAYESMPNFTHNFVPDQELTLTPEATWLSPLDLIEDTDPAVAKQKYDNFINQLSPYEKDLIFEDPDAAMAFISVVIGIKPCCILESTSQFGRNSSIVQKSGIRFINGAWVNDQALKTTLNNSGVLFSETGYQYFTQHLMSNSDDIVDDALAMIRGIALGYGRENAQLYSDFRRESRGLFVYEPTISDLVRYGIPQSEAEFVVTHLGQNRFTNSPETDRKIVEILTSHQFLSPQNAGYLVYHTTVKHLGDTFSTVCTSNYQQKLDQRTADFFKQAGILNSKYFPFSNSMS